MKKKPLITLFLFLVLGVFILMKAPMSSSGVITEKGDDLSYSQSTLPAKTRDIASIMGPSKKGIISSIKNIERCLVESCSYPDNDSREYELSVYRDLNKKIINLYRIVLDDGVEAEAISKLARHYLTFEDGYVKEGALNLMSTQPPSMLSFNALKKNVFKFHDPLIAQQGMAELLKYRKHYPSEVTSVLVDVLRTGGISVREAVSKDLASFITAKNLPKFISVRSRYQSGSVVYRLISMAIVEFGHR
ncbi:MAG: hypothetical protein KAG61_02940 [Bacteriovoracaceae bacterium]|nr:hypothetical protein [Bacteriovoracaceae bacterium]